MNVMRNSIYNTCGRCGGLGEVLVVDEGSLPRLMIMREEKKKRGKDLESREDLIPEKSGSPEGAVNHGSVVCGPAGLRMWLLYRLTLKLYILS